MPASSESGILKTSLLVPFLDIILGVVKGILKGPRKKTVVCRYSDLTCGRPQAWGRGTYPQSPPARSGGQDPRSADRWLILHP